MAKLNGYGGTVTWDSVAIAANKWNCTIDCPELDVTDSDSNDWQSIICGTKKATGSFSTFINAQDLSTFITGVVAALVLKIGKSNKTIFGNALVTAAAIDNTVGSPVPCVCSFSSDGEWAFGTVED